MSNSFVAGNVWLPNDVFRQRTTNSWPIPAPWTPQIGKASLHLDSSIPASLTLNGNRVTEWSDRIGNFAFRQTELPLTPLYVGNALAAKGVIEFENTNQFLESLNPEVIQVETLVALVRPRALTYTSTSAPPTVGALDAWQILSFTADPRDVSRGINISKLWGLGLFSGQVAEIIGFSEVISPADVELAEAYLAYNWNSATLLPAEHPYRNTAPTGLRY